VSALGTTERYWGLLPEHSEVYVLRLSVADVDFASLIKAHGPLGWNQRDELNCQCHQQGGQWQYTNPACQTGEPTSVCCVQPSSLVGLGADEPKREDVSPLKNFVVYVGRALPKGYNIYGLTVWQYSPCELERLNQAISHVGGHYSAFANVDVVIRIGDVEAIPGFAHYWRPADAIVNDLNTGDWKKEFGGNVVDGHWLYITDDDQSSIEAIAKWQMKPAIYDHLVPAGATPSLEQAQCVQGSEDLCSFWTGIADYPQRNMYPLVIKKTEVPDSGKKKDDYKRPSKKLYWTVGIIGLATIVVALNRKAIIRSMRK
jgi:hypothetical protein